MAVLDGQQPGLSIDPSLSPDTALPMQSAPAASPAAAPKAKGKGGENTLNLLGTLAGLAGKLVFGPDFDADLGAPFKAGAAMMQKHREEQSLMELLGSNPHTSPMLDGAKALHDAGGVMNNPEALLHPDVLNTFKVGHNSPDLMATLGGLGNQLQANATPPSQVQPGAQAPAVAPSAPALPTTGGGNVPAMLNPASPEFLQRAATLRPDMAEKIVMDRAGQKVSPFDDVIKMFTMDKAQRDANEHLTPQQQADLKVKTATDEFKATAPLREQEKAAEKQQADDIKNSSWTDKESTALRGKQIAISDLQNLINSGELKPDPAMSSVSKIPFLGPAIAGAVNPKFRELQKKLEAVSTDVMAGQPNNRGGVRMLNAIKMHLPTDSEYSQGLAEGIAKDNIQRIQEAMYQQLASTHPKKPIGDFADPQKVSDYKLLNQMENADPTKAGQDPRIQGVRKAMGLMYNKQALGEQ